MIVPRPTLILIVAVTLVPLLGVGGLWPSLVAPFWTLFVALVVAVLIGRTLSPLGFGPHN